PPLPIRPSTVCPPNPPLTVTGKSESMRPFTVLNLTSALKSLGRVTSTEPFTEDNFRLPLQSALPIVTSTEPLTDEASTHDLLDTRTEPFTEVACTERPRSSAVTLPFTLRAANRRLLGRWTEKFTFVRSPCTLSPRQCPPGSQPPEPPNSLGYTAQIVTPCELGITSILTCSASGPIFSAETSTSSPLAVWASILPLMFFISTTWSGANLPFQ